MADNKTEDASVQRRQKAHQRGQVLRSREFTSAITLLFATLGLAWMAAGWIVPWRKFFSLALEAADPSAMISQTILLKTALLVSFAVAPVMLLAFSLAVGASLAQGGFVISAEGLSPNFARLNPAANLKKLFSLRGMTPLMRSLLPGSYIAWLAISMLRRDWQIIIHASHQTVAGLIRALMGEAYEVSWKSGLVMLTWSALDYGIQKHDFENSLKMTKQEVREENKDSMGNPQIKGRIRNLQRQLRRRIMLKNVARATVVVTNPTHYAVAIEYSEDMEAPTVLAKGRNLIAQQIKKLAAWEGIPVVENKPLAQSLYRTVEVGQSIPPQLYTAVAEILAFIYRAQAMAAAAAAARGANARNSFGGFRP
jgi:flagellar biosynthetic protein FlhB